MSERMETWTLDKDENGGYSQSNGKDIKQIFSPIQVSVIRGIIQEEIKKEKEEQEFQHRRAEMFSHRLFS